MTKLWGGKSWRRAGLSMAAASSVLALGGMVLPGLSTPAAADAASDALAYQSDGGYHSGDNCVCAFAWEDIPTGLRGMDLLMNDSSWKQATKKVYNGTLADVQNPWGNGPALGISASLVFGNDVFVAEKSSGGVRPYDGSAVSSFQTRIVCNVSTGSGVQMKVLFSSYVTAPQGVTAYPVGGFGWQFGIGAGRPNGYDDYGSSFQPVPADGALAGLNVGVASDYPVPLTLDVKTGDASWAYTAGVLPAGVDEAVFQVASIARTPQTVRYRSLSSWDSQTQTSDWVCRQDVIGSSAFGNCAAVVVQHIRVLRPSALVADSAATAVGVPVTVNVLANDSLSVKAGAGSVVGVSTPVHGSVVDLGGGKLQYSPVAGYQGVDSFTYQVRDEKLGVTRSATVTINVGTTAPSAAIAPPAVTPNATVPTPGRLLPKTDGDDAAGMLAVFGVAGAVAGGLVLNRRRSR